MANIFASTASELANKYKTNTGAQNAIGAGTFDVPAVTTPGRSTLNGGRVQQAFEPVAGEVKIADATSGSYVPQVNPWTLESDPVYQAAMAQGQSQFNRSRNQAMFDKTAAEQTAAQDRQSLDKNATESRRRLAGNYAARGMAGGAAGALTLAEAEANAKQIAAQTSLKDKIAAVNANYLENYGAVGTDWTGTLAGQEYKTAAAQAALNAQLAKYGAA